MFNRKITETYDYKDEVGELLYQNVRYEPLVGIDDQDWGNNYPTIDRVRLAQNHLKEKDEFGNIQNGNRYACPLIIATTLVQLFLRKLTLKEFMLKAMDAACDELNIGHTVAGGPGE